MFTLYFKTKLGFFYIIIDFRWNRIERLIWHISEFSYPIKFLHARNQNLENVPIVTILFFSKKNTQYFWCNSNPGIFAKYFSFGFRWDKQWKSRKSCQNVSNFDLLQYFVNVCTQKYNFNTMLESIQNGLETITDVCLHNT